MATAPTVPVVMQEATGFVAPAEVLGIAGVKPA